MLLAESTILETHYDILSVREDASYEEIRTSYRSAILNHHPDKLHGSEASEERDDRLGDRFLEVQKAWEVLSNSRSRAIYDSELRASRQDTAAAEDVNLEDMTVEDDGEVVELYYQCRCGDYFSVDSLELSKIGYTILKNDKMISVQTLNASPASVILSCGSCSLHLRLLIKGSG